MTPDEVSPFDKYQKKRNFRVPNGAKSLSQGINVFCNGFLIMISTGSQLVQTSRSSVLQDFKYMNILTRVNFG